MADEPKGYAYNPNGPPSTPARGPEGEEPGAFSRFATGFAQHSRPAGAGPDPFGAFMAGFAKSRAAKKAREAAAAARPTGGLATVAAPYQPTAREDQAQTDYLQRIDIDRAGAPKPTWQKVNERVVDERINGPAAPGAPSGGDFSMAAHGRGGLMTSPAVVPNRATPAEMDAMGNADYLAQRGVAPPPVENPYREGGFSRDVPPEANDYGPNPYR